MTSDHSDDPTGQVPIQPAPEPRQSTEPPAAPPRSAPPPSTATPPPPRSAPRPPDADRGRNASLILGLVFLVIGGWFFATTTLGLDLPDLDWGQFWPVILIILGLAIVLRSLDRRRS
jgi:hypothetical protein